jgi:lysophospholipase L1-like esterase
MTHERIGSVSFAKKTTLPATRFLTLFLLTALAMLGLTVPAGAAGPNYVALGDSYSSGVGAGDYGSSGDCRRSANSYPRLWADSHSVSSFDFVACSGARTGDVLSKQVDALSASTTVATISIGGNDTGFVDVMTDCTLGSDESCVDRVEVAKNYARNSLPDLLDHVYTEMRTRAPNAEFIVMGYPKLYKLNGSCSGGLSETKRAAINSGSDTLAEVTAKRAADAGFTFVDMRDPFTGHEICSGDSWLHSLTWPVVESYHPTKAGQSLGYLPALNAVTD